MAIGEHQRKPCGFGITWLRCKGISQDRQLVPRPRLPLEEPTPNSGRNPVTSSRGPRSTETCPAYNCEVHSGILISASDTSPMLFVDENETHHGTMYKVCAAPAIHDQKEGQTWDWNTGHWFTGGWAIHHQNGTRIIVCKRNSWSEVQWDSGFKIHTVEDWSVHRRWWYSARGRSH